MDKTLETIIKLFGRTDVCASVFGTLLVLLVTYYFMAREDDRKMDDAVRKLNERKSKKKTSVSSQEDEEAKEELDDFNDEPPPLVSDKTKDFLTKKELDEMLLDSEDIEMIRKGGQLDTKDPTAVKHYVQEVRTLSYKGKNLTSVEKEREEEMKQRQLSQIYALMNQQKEKFGETTIDDLKEQMTMYNQ